MIAVAIGTVIGLAILATVALEIARAILQIRMRAMDRAAFDYRQDGR